MENFVTEQARRIQEEIDRVNAEAQAKLETLNEQLGLLNRLAELSGEGENPVNLENVPNYGDPRLVVNVAKPKPVMRVEAVENNGQPRKRGRPKGSKNKKTAEGTAGRDGKSIDLPSILETIGQQVQKPLVLADFVTLAREAGYATKSKDFSNMVYQALLKLVKRGSFKKNEETRAYEFVQKAA